MLMMILTLLACRTPPPAVQPLSDVWNEYETVSLGSGKGCTIVAIHGYGGNPRHFRTLYDEMAFDATVLLPRGPIRQGPKGWAWFARSKQVSPEELARQIDAEGDKIAAALARLPITSKHKPIITGFSQGGMLAFAIGTDHPEAIAASLPLSGILPASLFPTKVSDTPIRAFHGEIDQVLAPEGAIKPIQRLKAAGWDASIRTYPSVSHAVSPQMKADYESTLRELCEK